MSVLIVPNQILQPAHYVQCFYGVRCARSKMLPRSLTITRLSAYLYEATNQQQYYNAATLSAQFIKSQLYNGTIILDTVNVADCSLKPFVLTYNSGFFIEGLSVYANHTGSSDWTTL